tara:strand:- start:203 stop:568 length:366 start_codon:yes stop_codon:yes gene_type:complete
VSFKSFSQKDTIVSLKQPIAKLVIKDLITGDGAKEELRKTVELLQLEQKKIVIKDSVIGNLDIKVTNLESIITKKNEQFGLESEKSLELEKELKGEKRKTLLYKIGTYIGVGALLVLLGGR